MSELGELLELIYTAHAQLSTFEAEYRDWMKPRPSLDLSTERSELGEPQIRWRGGGPFPRTLVARRWIWLCAPDRVRVEIVSDRQLARVGVRDGPRWLLWDREKGVVSNDLSDVIDGRPMIVPPFLSPPLIEPTRLLAALWFEPAGKSTRAGRQVLTARARPRHPSRSAQTLTHELDFDAEHGTILRRATLDHGEPISVTDAVHVRYQHPIEPERFELVPPDAQSAPVAEGG